MGERRRTDPSKRFPEHFDNINTWRLVRIGALLEHTFEPYPKLKHCWVKVQVLLL